MNDDVSQASIWAPSTRFFGRDDDRGGDGAVAHALSSPLGPSAGPPPPGGAWFWLKKSKDIASSRRLASRAHSCARAGRRAVATSTQVPLSFENETPSEESQFITAPLAPSSPLGLVLLLFV